MMFDGQCDGGAWHYGQEVDVTIAMGREDYGRGVTRWATERCVGLE